MFFNFLKRIFSSFFLEEVKEVEKIETKTASIQNGSYVLNTGEIVSEINGIAIRNIEVEDFDEETNKVMLEATFTSQSDCTSLIQRLFIDRAVFERIIHDGAETIMDENPYRKIIKNGTQVLFFNVDMWSKKQIEGLVLNTVTSPRECGKLFASAFFDFYGKKDVKIFLSRKVEVCEPDDFDPEDKWEHRIEDGQF